MKKTARNQHRLDSLARDYLEVYRRLVHTAPEPARHAPLAVEPMRPASWQGPDHRKTSRSHMSLLGALHRVGDHGGICTA